jgi:hypothetical protein
VSSLTIAQTEKMLAYLRELDRVCNGDGIKDAMQFFAALVSLTDRVHELLGEIDA